LKSENGFLSTQASPISSSDILCMNFSMTE
jgi:hypothetical protein